MITDIDRARDAFYAIPADLPRDDWVKAGMAAHAAGIDFDAFNDWSAGASNYDAAAAHDTWRSFKAGKGIGEGTLFKLATDNGWRTGESKPQRQSPTQPRPVRPPCQPAPGMSPADVWSRCEAATAQHPYITQKRATGVPLDGLRIVPADDCLTVVQSESMAGALVVPVIRLDGSISSLQFIAPPNVAARLKAKSKPGKLNLPGCPLQGSFTVGKLLPGGVVHICEGIGQAWACWQATGDAAVVCFGWGRVRAVAAELRACDASARLVLVPDVGKESDAAKIALEVGALVVSMPDGWAQNSDVNDLAQRDGWRCAGRAAGSGNKAAPA